MSKSTPLLDLPFIMAAQAQKHVTHNDALLNLDALVQLSVLSRTVADPPASPQEGDRYLVASPATGDWTGKEDAVAAFQDGVWQFHIPRTGWRLWIGDETRFLVHDGSQWRSVLASADLQNLSMLGINTTADATNKLSVASDAVLFNHNGADSQVKVNKAAASDTASHLFQNNYSGRAEFGLAGDDDFHAKVSPDGSTWNEGILIDKSTGVVTFPSGVGESGSFTPAVSFTSNGDFSPTYTTQLGAYRRIDDLVWIALFLQFDTNAYTTASGQFQITGLPFAVYGDATQLYYPMGHSYTANVTFNSNTDAFTVLAWQGHTVLRFGISSNAAVNTQAGTLQFVPSTSGMKIWIAGVFKKA